MLQAAAAEENVDPVVESQATAGSYEAARERASGLAAAAAEDFQRKHAEIPGRDPTEL